MTNSPQNHCSPHSIPSRKPSTSLHTAARIAKGETIRNYARANTTQLTHELVTGCTSGGYDQFETSPEAIEQELRPAVCERRQTDLRQIIV